MAATIPYPWPQDFPSRYDLIAATILARSAYGKTVSEMVTALDRLGLDVTAVRKPLVPSRPEGVWLTRAVARWVRIGKSTDSPDVNEIKIDLSDPLGQDADPLAAATVEDLAICALLDRIITSYARGGFDA